MIDLYQKNAFSTRACPCSPNVYSQRRRPISYSGWQKHEILGLTWDEIDMASGVIRLSLARSKTLVERILLISQPIAEALALRRARRDRPARRDAP